MIKDDLFLNTPKAVELYEKYAKNAPIYDYHCHLSPREIYEDKVFENISHLWLGADHYKWRAMRIAGLDEFYITGAASPLEKFKAYAKVCSRLIGSPLYLWSNLELKNYFGISETLNQHNAEAIYHQCNDLIKNQQLRPSTLIAKSNVRLICTTDDPADNLEWHARIAEENRPGLQVLPTYRPDRSLNIQLADYCDYLQLLGDSCQVTIANYSDLLECLRQRLEFFVKVGCLLTDHAIENICIPETSLEAVAAIFAKRIQGAALTPDEIAAFHFWTLHELAAAYCKHGMLMQLHLGAMRNVNSEMFRQLGPDSGYDIMTDVNIAEPLAALLNSFHESGNLPATVLYTLNSKDNLVLSSLPQCFQNGKTPGTVIFGVAWWLNDHRDGILEYFKSTAAQSMLPYSLGMLTDSRSFLSYTRHDYFRRLLCQYFGQLVESGEFDDDQEILHELIDGICCQNIKRRLGL